MLHSEVTKRWRGVAIGILSVLCATAALAGRDRSIVDDRVREASWRVSSPAAAVTSPGLQIARTLWDRQHYYSPGHQVAKNPGADVVHFTWVWWDDDPPGGPDFNERNVAYNSYSISSGVFNQGEGTIISIASFTRAFSPRIDVGSANLGHVSFYQKLDEASQYFAWDAFFPMEGELIHLDNMLPIGSDPPDQVGNIWPDVAVTQRAQGDIWHVIAMGLADWYDPSYPDRRIWYWRYDAAAPSPSWEGPVMIDSTDLGPSYVIDAGDNSNRVAIAFHSGWSTDGLNELRNVVYVESQTAGAGWINGSELGSGFRNLVTSYDNPSGPQAWTDISIAYDHAGRLHIVWSEQRIADASEQIAIRHWSSERGTIRTVALGYYDNPHTHERALNLDQLTLGIGDGSTLCRGGAASNEDYLYVLYAKLGGETPEEQADVSDLGYANGELYLTVSPDDGYNWSLPVNLTNTKTPGCDPHVNDPCASEMYATIGRDVDDIHIFYMLDVEAASAVESGWALNSAMYLRFPGGTVDAPYLCPECICPCTGDPHCDEIMNVLDVITVVNEAFKGSPAITDPGCTHISRSDLNCDCVVNVLDVVLMVGRAFRGVTTPFCDPCEEPCPR